jgi:hypothetical protein
MAPYLFPDGTGFLLPIVAVDRGWLHLEGRYNYEAQKTGSVWIGWNLEWGEKLTFALTPMLGGVFGDLNGVAPGAEWTLAWGPVELYTEFEFVIDCGDVSGSSIYGWTELSARPWDWVRGGVALQRTRSTGSPRGVQWGPLVGFDWRMLTLSTYWFNPGQSDAQYWVVSLGFSL